MFSAIQGTEMKKQFRITLLAAALVATGCATSGAHDLASADRPAIERAVIDGKTTAGQVRAMFGEPQTRLEGDPSMWVYTHTRSGLRSEVKTLGVRFNRAGVVTSHTFEIASSI